MSYPAITPQVILLRNNQRGLVSQGREIVPLGGISSAPTVYCREGGDLVTYISDRYGFRNDDAIWDETHVEMAAVGDSYVQGSCMPEDQHLVSHLRSRYGSVLNMGSFGNGPLANLGVVQEYLTHKKPRWVLWFYVANDLAIDLPLERHQRTLKNYQRPGFSQHLRSRQLEVDGALKPFLDEELERQLGEIDRKGSWMKLSFFRHWAKVWFERWLRPPPPDLPAAFDYDRQRSLDYDFHAVLVAKAAARVADWGGKLVFVIVPDARMFSRSFARDAQPRVHVERLKSSIARIGVPVVSLYDDFRALDRPLDFYVPLGGYYGHFNPRGYRQAAKFLIGQIDAIRARAPGVASAP